MIYISSVCLSDGHNTIEHISGFFLHLCLLMLVLLISLFGFTNDLGLHSATIFWYQSAAMLEVHASTGQRYSHVGCSLSDDLQHIVPASGT